MAVPELQYQLEMKKTTIVLLYITLLLSTLLTAVAAFGISTCDVVHDQQSYFGYWKPLNFSNELLANVRLGIDSTIPQKIRIDKSQTWFQYRNLILPSNFFIMAANGSADPNFIREDRQPFYQINSIAKGPEIIAHRTGGTAALRKIIFSHPVRFVRLMSSEEANI